MHSIDFTYLQHLSLLALAQLVLCKHPQLVDGPRPQPRNHALAHQTGQYLLLALGEPILCNFSTSCYTQRREITNLNDITRPALSFHWTTSLSTLGDAASIVQETFTEREDISRMERFPGVGGGSAMGAFSILIEEVTWGFQVRSHA